MVPNFKIRTRFILLLWLFIAGFAIFGGWTFKTINELKVNGPLYERIVQSKDLIADILPPPEYIIESYLVSLQLVDAQDAAKQDVLIQRLKTLKADYDNRYQFWQSEKLEAPLNDIFLKQAHEPALAFYKLVQDEFIPAVQKGDRETAMNVLGKINLAYDAHRKIIDQVVDMANKRAENDEAAAKSRIAISLWSLAAILLVSLALAVGVAMLIMRGILKPLQEAVYIAKTVASGDLRNQIAVTSTDETGQLLQSLKDMNESLVRIVSQVRVGTNAISDASSQIAAGNLDLSIRTEKQAHSLAETASSMEELTDTVRQNADSATQATMLAETASGVAGKGGEVVDQVVLTMGSIDASAKKIVDIISVIDGIAFQTNILALNAAVEAARAGEQGRGFAVVASEVRNLAQRSATAAKEIKALIGNSVEQVGIGTQLVDQAGSTMQDVVASVQRVSHNIREIASASQSQNAGIQQVNATIAQMDETTQQNAALVEQAAAAAESLHQQAESLRDIVSVFKLADESSAFGEMAINARRAPNLTLISGSAVKKLAG
ncbi:MAG: HAMP domain-containing protein [Burkholderiales bacterium]|nr:HAMP domain-containing protein [Burkholderiales bacterium]